MPQIVHPTVINLPNTNVGLFGMGAAGSSLLSPVFAGLGSAAGEWMHDSIMGESPEKERQRLENDELRRGQAQDLILKHKDGMINDDQLSQGLSEFGFDSKDDARLVPGHDQIATNAIKRETLRAAGYNHQTGEFDIDVPDFEVGKSAPAVGKVSDIPMTGDVIAAGDPSQIDPGRVTEEGYLDQFAAGGSGPAGIDLKRLTPADRKRALRISNQMQGYFDALKMANSKELSTPENRAKVNATIQQTEKDLSDLADMYNIQNGPGDINLIKTMGLPGATLKWAELQVLGDPRYLSTLKPEQKEAAAKRVTELQNLFRHVSAQQMEMFKRLAPDGNALKTLFDYQVANRSITAKAIADKDELGYKYTELEKFKIAHLNYETNQLLFNIHQKGIENEMDRNKLALDISKFQQDGIQFAQQLGLDRDKQAVETYSAVMGVHNANQKNQIEALSAILRFENDTAALGFKGMGKVGQMLGGAMDLKDLVSVGTALSTSPSDEDQTRGWGLISKAGKIAEASLIGDQSTTVENLLSRAGQAFISWLGIPAADPNNPQKSAQLRGQMLADGLQSKAKETIDQLRKLGNNEIPVDLTNMAYFLEFDPRKGTLRYSKDALRPEGNAKVQGKSMDERASILVNVMRQMTPNKLSFSDFLNFQDPITKKRVRDLPNMQDRKSQEKFYNIYASE